jgi:hypothetical protein
MDAPVLMDGGRTDECQSHRARHLEPRRPRGGGRRWALAACGLVLLGLVVAAVIRGTRGDERVPAPEARAAFAQASHRLISAGVFAYHGSAQVEVASAVRPGPWLAADVAIEGEVQLPVRTHEVVLDAAGRAAETVTIGPIAWGRLAEDRDELSKQAFAVVSEGPPVMGAALVAEWLGTTTVRRRDGTDDHGRPAYTATFETAPTEPRPNQPRVEGDVRLILDPQGDPAGVEIDGITDGARFRMQIALSDIGGDISIPAPGGQELGVTGPVTRGDANAAGISHPVQLGRVPKGWVLMRMIMETGQPRPGCSILRLEYRHVDGHGSAGNAYANDDSIALVVTSPACNPVSDLPNWYLHEPFAAGRFSGFVSTSNSFDSLDGLVSDGKTSVQFATDLDVEDARSVLESLRPFEPVVQPKPVDLAQTATSSL